MKQATPDFTGLSRKAFDFMKGLRKNNNKQWFDAHREMYENDLVAPARALISQLGEFIHYLNPAFEVEPKFNKAIMRITKDMRFAKGAPYRDYFLVRFGRWKMDSELFLVWTSEGLEVGIFVNNSPKEDTSFFRANVTQAPELFVKTCNEFGIGRTFSVFDLAGDNETIIPRFDPARDKDRIAQLRMFLIERSHPPSHRRLYRPEFLTDIMTIFSRLYPIWIFAASTHPADDLERYRSLVDPHDLPKS